jgi:RecA-family ATPase
MSNLGGFRGLTSAELLAWQAPRITNIIEKNILPVGGTAVIYGPSGAGKSIVALDLITRIAAGISWCGYNTRPTPTYYFQTEIPQHLLKQRFQKYHDNHTHMTTNFWMASALYTKINKGTDASNMEREMARTGAELLVIDPLNSSMSGNLVDAYQVRTQILDKLDQWRATFNCATLLIHHDRQSEHHQGETYSYGPEEMFGAEVLKWADTVIRLDCISDQDPIITLRLQFQKIRHAESLLPPLQVQCSRLTLHMRTMTPEEY